MWRERGRFSPQKDQTGRKRQTKSDRAVGPQNDSKGKKRSAMERERSCCRRENVIKYPGSWENAPLLRDWETDLSRFCRRGVGTEFTDTAGRGHTPGWLLSAFGRFTFSPSPTVLKKTFRNWVGEALGPPARIRTGGVGSANSGAVRKPQQNQILHTQGPVARKKTQASTPDFARRNHGSTNQESAPVKRGPGKGDYGHE